MSRRPGPHTSTTAVAVPPVVVSGLTVAYDQRIAVDNLSLSVQQGEIFGLIGPNGAGKTSTLEAVMGLRRRHSGRVEVFGLDPARDRLALTRVMGVQLQESAFPSRVRVAEMCRVHAALYGDRHAYVPLLEEFGLAESARQPVSKLSGGQRQRLSLVLALLGHPRLVLLDELTTGLDPSARRLTWELVQRVNAEGTTVVLTSHFMDEVEFLCDRVAVMVAGRVVAQDDVAGIVRRGGEHHTYVVDTPLPPAQFRGLPGVATSSAQGRRVIVRGEHPLALDSISTVLAADGASAQAVRTRPPTLEDAYLDLTGQQSPEGAPRAGVR